MQASVKPEVVDGRRARSEREAVDAIASFEMWHRLRYHQRLSKRATIEVLVGLLNRQLKD